MKKAIKETKAPTREELERELRASQDAMHERAMADILDAVEALSERANRADYEPTLKEMVDFRKIHAIINNLDKLF